MMTSVATLHAANLTLGNGDEGNEGTLEYMEGLSASSILPSETYLGLQSTQGPSEVPHSFPEVEWMVGVGVRRAWVDILVLVLKGLVMLAVIVVSVLGNLLVIVSVARYVPANTTIDTHHHQLSPLRHHHYIITLITIS